MQNSLSLSEAAEQYASAGYKIIPLKPLSKEPLTHRGYKDSSRELHQIKKWWSRWPDANIGLLTGKVNNIFVIDVDGELPDSFPELPSPTVKTGRGYHYYYEYPEGGMKSRIKINSFDVDIKSDGGYVVAAPSIHPNGGRYELVN